MVVLFGYTSNQKAIKIAKDQLKAHLLAVRLFQDQLHVVMGSYGRILRGTGRYLKLAFMPLLYVIIPITLLIVQLDRYLGSTGFQTNVAFLVTVRVSNPDALNDISLELPTEITMTAPAVHVPAAREIVWRLAPTKEGTYEVRVAAAGQNVTKTVRQIWRGCRWCACAGTSGRECLARPNLRYPTIARSSPSQSTIQSATLTSPDTR